MAYNSFFYLGMFLVAAWAVWAVLPQKARPGLLLCASLLFFWVNSGHYILWVFAAAAVAFAAGLCLGRLDGLYETARPTLEKPARKAFRAEVTALKKGVVALAAAAILGVLLVLKYTPFFAHTVNDVLLHIPGASLITFPAFVMPLGLSFYTLMAVSYIVDVYRGVIRPAEAYWRVLLYLSFWPHIVEGPFDRYGALEAPLFGPQKPSWQALTFGMQRILWGMMKKVVLADRANMLVKAVFDDATQYSGLAVVLGTLCYTLQIYAEFSGCMDIALGSAELFGIPLAENFRQPFFACSVGEFWRRWHITLGAWLKEYLFQPLVMSRPFARMGRFFKGKFGPAAGRNWPVWLGLIVTWLAIGFWHGAGWLYAAYGLYYCFLQLLGDQCEPLLLRVFPKLPAWRKTRPYALWQMLRTFALVNLGMLLFRAQSLEGALGMLTTLNDRYEGSYLIGLDGRDLFVLAVGALVLFAVDLLHERGVRIRRALAARPLVLRWAVYIAAVLVVMIFGAYGDNYDPAAFIYAQF